MGLVLASHEREPDNIQVIARELRADQALQGHCHLFCSRLAPVVDHTHTHINHQHSRGPRGKLGAVTSYTTEWTDMPAKTIAFELIEDILERFLPDLAHAASS